jgi:hypothetical protein
MVAAWVTWPTGARAPQLTLIAIGITLAVAIGVMALAAPAVFAPLSGAQQMFEDIR